MALPLTLSCTAAPQSGGVWDPQWSAAPQCGGVWDSSSSYNILDEPDSFTDLQFSGTDALYQEQETICFADKLIDIDFLLLDLSARSNALTLPTLHPSINRKRPIWKDNARLAEEFLLKKSVKKMRTIGCMFTEEDSYIDIMSTSSSSPAHLSSSSYLTAIRKEENEARLEIKHYRDPGTELKNRNGGIEYGKQGGTVKHSYPPRRLYPTYTVMKHKVREYKSICKPRVPEEPTMEELTQKLKDGVLNPREEMHLLRLSCPCQARSTGKNTHLWEFLLEMLADKRMRSVIAWTGHAREFKVVNSREVAREWGNRKNKPHMNFDKMSRAMRYYYKKNILTHGNKQRLVYSFCQSAICPHYEKIVKLALRTRPAVGTPTSSSTALTRETPQSNWHSEHLIKNAASHNLKVESEKMLTQKLCPQQSIKKWSVNKSRRDGLKGIKREGYGQNETQTGSPGSRGMHNATKMYQPGTHNSLNKKTCYWRSTTFNKNTEQTKIKIAHTKLSHTDCFKFC